MYVYILRWDCYCWYQVTFSLTSWNKIENLNASQKVISDILCSLKDKWKLVKNTIIFSHLFSRWFSNRLTIWSNLCNCNLKDFFHYKKDNCKFYSVYFLHSTHFFIHWCILKCDKKGRFFAFHSKIKLSQCKNMAVQLL